MPLSRSIAWPAPSDLGGAGQIAQQTATAAARGRAKAEGGITAEDRVGARRGIEPDRVGIGISCRGPPRPVDVTGVVSPGTAPEGLVRPGLVSAGLVRPASVNPGVVAETGGTLRPGAVSPGVVRPGVVSPGVVRPGVVSPGVVRAAPGAVRPGAVRPGAVRPGLVRPRGQAGRGQRPLTVSAGPAEDPAARRQVDPELREALRQGTEQLVGQIGDQRGLDELAVLRCGVWCWTRRRGRQLLLDLRRPGRRLRSWLSRACVDVGSARKSPQICGLRVLGARVIGLPAATHSPVESVNTDVVDGTYVTSETGGTMRNRERIATCRSGALYIETGRPRIRVVTPASDTLAADDSSFSPGRCAPAHRPL